jgi:hypothetical protein
MDYTQGILAGRDKVGWPLAASFLSEQHTLCMPA